MYHTYLYIYIYIVHCYTTPGTFLYPSNAERDDAGHLYPSSRPVARETIKIVYPKGLWAAKRFFRNTCEHERP